MTNEALHVFVYGTLKPGEANFEIYCGNRVISSQRAYVYGELYDLPSLGYPGLLHGNSQVHGFVLWFNHSTILQELDELEDFKPHRHPAENDYNRESIVAHISDDRTSSLWAWTYFMNPDLIERLGGVHLPDGWWEPKPT
jgi:gamma-glutamylcyclotransferase (GGCT)/AIG2-like uncharacterized protein YtfP